MNNARTFLVATDGQAVLRSHDNGETWRRLTINQDLEFDDTVRSLLVDRRTPGAVFAGAETGLFRSEDYGAHWQRVDCELNKYAVWKVIAHPRHPDIMYAGTGSPTRAAFFRSSDGGRRWEKMPLEMPPKCLGVSRPRMLTIECDPDNFNDVWAGVEEGGVFRSRDGGESWQRLDDVARADGIRNSDVHCVTILPGPPRTLVVMTVNALYFSTNDGETWREFNARQNWNLYYSRVMTRKPGSTSELYVGVGDGTPGTTSMFLRSTDCGQSWTAAAFPVQPNSCIWAFGTHHANPDTLLAGTKYGHLFRSENGGLSWRKEWREFSEITDVAWLPGASALTEESSHA